MNQVIVHPKVISKNYIKKIGGFRFRSLYDLIITLFETYEKGTEDYENIRLLLEATGYNNLKQIPETEMDHIRATISRMMPEWKKLDDHEYMTYLVLAAIGRKDIIVCIDDQLVNQFEVSIQIKDTSIISFINCLKINQIYFNAL
jgi:hypothetical protein